MIKLNLISDFEQYYDGAFDIGGHPFYRIKSDNMSRKFIFQYLLGLGLRTPKFGSYQDFQDYRYYDNRPIIIHKEDSKGPYSVRKSFRALTQEDKQHLLSEYINTVEPESEYFSRCECYLGVGNSYTFYYESRSYDDWDGLKGKTKVEGITKIPRPEWASQIYYPLFLVTFVRADKFSFAVDFDMTPDCNAVLRGFLSPTDVVSSLKQWYEDFNSRFSEISNIGLFNGYSS